MEPASASGKIALQADRADRVWRSHARGPQAAGKRTEQDLAGGCRPIGRRPPAEKEARPADNAANELRQPELLPESIHRLPEVTEGRRPSIGSSRSDERPSWQQEPYPDTGRKPSTPGPTVAIGKSEDQPERRQASRKRPTVPIAVTHRPAVACRRPTRSSTILARADGADREFAGVGRARPGGSMVGQVLRQIHALRPAMADGPVKAAAIIEQLAGAVDQTLALAAKINDKTLAHQLRKTGLALERRVEIWRCVVRLDGPQAAKGAAAKRDATGLINCLDAVVAATGNSPEGPAWREYLCVEALRQRALCSPSAGDVATRRVRSKRSCV